MSTSRLSDLASRVVHWQRVHGRHDLPWQTHRDPYRIWLSEIMLQQTQVSTVVGYYSRFLGRFPTIQTLAAASLDDVMPYWAGLGYYSRARNLHRCARAIVNDYGGCFPRDPATLATLPGIGPSTAAAIASLTWGVRSPIMDGNVKRVFTRYFGVDTAINLRQTEKTLWKLAEDAVEAADTTLDMRAYTQGLMDLGATVCTRTRPDCAHCPLGNTCYAKQHQRQQELPVRAPRRTKPQRHCHMLVLQHQDQILLEQQPSPGIWGGLWSLPKFDNQQALDQSLADMGAVDGNKEENGAEKSGPLQAQPALPDINHVFTHFRLHIQTAHYIAAGTVCDVEPGPTQRWVALETLSQTALPAPVKTLLEEVAQRQARLVAADNDECS